MIIKQSNLIILTYLLALLTTFSCQTRDSRYGFVEENFEDCNIVSDQVLSVDSDLIIGKTHQVQDSIALSGDQAIILTQSSPFALNYTIERVRKEELIRVSVMYHGPGELVLVAQDDKDANYYYRKKTSELSDSSWTELSLEISIPPLMDGHNLRLYVWNPGSAEVFIDDWKLNYTKEKVFPEYHPAEAMHIYIDSLNLLRLEEKRKDAFINGILETEDGDFVDGILFYKDTIMPIDIRLKGDWLDHLEGRKWSFRIKVKKEFTWNRLKTFSIHNPAARDFLNEWVAHELLRDNDILATRYGFVPVTLNGRSLGVYAWEEHFEKQLLESLNRREGPILKFSEDHFWNTQKVYIDNKVENILPLLQTADILPFKQNRVFADSVLREQFLIGRTLMDQYRNRSNPISKIFDADKMAGYQALIDLSRGFHGLTWHNQRSYYNPIVGKLEPIFYDAYTELGVYNPDRQAISGLVYIDPATRKRFFDLFWLNIFDDNAFMESYRQWLRRVSDPQVLDSFFTRIGYQLGAYEKMIAKEYPDYKYDREFLYRNAQEIVNDLPKFDSYVAAQKQLGEQTRPDYILEEYIAETDIRLLPDFIKVYRDTTSDGDRVIIRNYYPQPVWVVASSMLSNRQEIYLEKSIKLDPFDGLNYHEIELSVINENQYIWFVTDDSNESFKCQIEENPIIASVTPVQEINRLAELDLPDGFQINGDLIEIPEQKWIIKRPIIIPRGYTVIFKAGAELDMIGGAFFLSNSSVNIEGDANKPVRIGSSDSTSQGFIVMQAQDESRVNHAKFSGLNTLAYKGWQLTGAVNFYESNVSITNTQFVSNLCEDALNIIRSDFTVRDSKFQDIFADAFDSDFCTGLVENVEFTDVGNDAIDFSGSKVIIRQCLIQNTGDKGVSCGENSSLIVEETRVVNANIAFASKDLSILKLRSCEVTDAVYGLVVFQKKPEFGPARIDAQKFSYQRVDSLHLVEIASELKLNSSLINGQQKQVARRFY